MKIIHIAQTHKSPFILIEHGKQVIPEFNKVVSSQFKVAEAIKKLLPCPIVDEGSWRNAVKRSCCWLPVQHIKEIFPNGFPEKFDELTLDQKVCLYQSGAAEILFALDKIGVLYRSVRTDATIKAMSDVLSGNEPIDLLNPLTSAVEVQLSAIDALRSQREKEAIECAEEAAFEDKGNIVNSTVIIVYGSAHDFKPYCDERGYEHERIDCSRPPPQQPRKRFWMRMLVIGALAELVLACIVVNLFSLGVLTPLMLGVAVATLTLPGSILVGIAALVLVFAVGALIGWLTRDNKTSAGLPPLSTAHHKTEAHQTMSPATRLERRTAELKIIVEPRLKERDEKAKRKQEEAENLKQREQMKMKDGIRPYDFFLRGGKVQQIEGSYRPEDVSQP